MVFHLTENEVKFKDLTPQIHLKKLWGETLEINQRMLLKSCFRAWSRVVSISHEASWTRKRLRYLRLADITRAARFENQLGGPTIPGTIKKKPNLLLFQLSISSMEVLLMLKEESSAEKRSSL
uniref:Uncharacterized protein n=1 Tax=Sphaerodactylus townsendi TaxID=933632 RepID=A0ACB8EJR1_9SAUR